MYSGPSGTMSSKRCGANSSAQLPQICSNGGGDPASETNTKPNITCEVTGLSANCERSSPGKVSRAGMPMSSPDNL